MLVLENKKNYIIRLPLLVGAIGILIALIFISDLLTPLGINSGVGYILVIFLGYWLPRSRYIFMIAAFCSLLVIAGYFFSPGLMAPEWSVITNRIFAIVSIIISAGFTARFRVLTKSHILNEKMLNATLTCATEAILVVNAEGDIIFINKSAKEIFGYEAYELLGKKIEILVPEAIREKHVQYRQKYMEHPKARPMGAGLDLKAVSKNGATFPVEISLSHFRVNGELFVTCFVMDISRRKIAEKELKQTNEELIETNRQLKITNSDKEQFLYATSHEMQEPIRMISSYAQLLEKKFSAELDSEKKNYLDIINKEARRMKDLLVAVSEFIKINVRENVNETVDCNVVINEALKQLKGELIQSNAQVKVENELPVLKGNKEQLLQLFIELIDNAIKFKSELPPLIRISSRDKENEWEICVQDNGISLDPKYADKIFKIFKKLHGNNEYEGPGIGLAIAHKVIFQHGGQIWYESVPGKGTTFHFTIKK